jgi:hypothetical protein
MAKKKWTLMVYNNYDDPTIGWLHRDIAVEMAAVGSTADVNLVVLCDDMSSSGAYSTPVFYCPEGAPPGTLVRHSGWDASEKDMAHPGTLVRFGTFVKEHFEAEHYALVMACHGFGWTQGTVRWMSSQREADLLDWLVAQATRSSWTAPLSPLPPMGVPVGAASPANPATGLWRSMTLSPDSTSQTEMSAISLGLALETISSAMGKRIDLLAFDACFMQMAEIAFEVERAVDTMVGPEWYGHPWDYTDLCSRLVANPHQTPRQLAQTMVASYEWYQQQRYTVRYTLSALDLREMANLAMYLNAFVSAWAREPVAPATATAVTRATQLIDEQRCFRDLGDFLWRLLHEQVSYQLWFAAAWLYTKLTRDVVLAHCAHSTPTPAGLTEGSERYLDRTTGLSIQLPLFCSPNDPNCWAYRDLRMSQVTHWDELLLSSIGPKL